METKKTQIDKEIHLTALKFRHEKIKDYLANENPTELETSIIKFWIKHHGNETY